MQNPYGLTTTYLYDGIYYIENPTIEDFKKIKYNYCRGRAKTRAAGATIIKAFNQDTGKVLVVCYPGGTKERTTWINYYLLRVIW